MNKKQKLNEIIRHAYQTVPLYYRIAEKSEIDYAASSIDAIPVIDKSYYVDYGASVLSSNYMSDYLGETLMWTRTSGSTGKFVEVYWKKSEYDRSLHSLWLYRYKFYRIKPTDRLCYFFSTTKDEDRDYKQRNAIGFAKNCIYDGCLHNVYSEILEYDPVWMILQPSVALLLCEQAVHRKQRPKSLRYIEMTGEYLDPSVRKRVKSVFDCAIANQYGTKEVNSIAYECPEGKMHCMTNNVYVEILGNREEGEICVTTLQNRVMPLVRFNMEDRGKIRRNVKCSCGCTGDILELYAGRADDWIQCRNGEKIPAYVLIQMMHRINHQFEGTIIQFQIIQETWERFHFFLVLDEDVFQEKIIQQIRKGMGQRIGDDVEVTIDITDRLLPRKQTGKLACFLSEMRGKEF